ncbi:MAG: glycosyltransferase family 2 protein [Candidatus Saccharimonadales bacterium]
MGITHNLKNSKISVVIAAYNEAPRIERVLKVVDNHPLIDEVIVVNDGSCDGTSEVCKKFKLKLIENEKNLGKTLSVKKGILASKNDLIMLLDADLIGLDSQAIEQLAKPVLSGRVNWTLSVRKNSFAIMRLAKIDWMSGERVVPKKLLMDDLIWSRPDIGYSLETLMNKSLLDSKRTFRSVFLPNVSNTNKSNKNGNGFVRGWAKNFHMIGQISKVVPFHEFIGQFFVMTYLNNKYR